MATGTTALVAEAVGARSVQRLSVQ